METKKEQPKVPVKKPEVVKPATARDLSKGLQGTVVERNEEEKTITLKMTAGQRPDIVFTGFWNGKLIRAASNSIARAYRVRRFKPRRPV